MGGSVSYFAVVSYTVVGRLRPLLVILRNDDIDLFRALCDVMVCMCVLVYFVLVLLLFL